MSRQKAAGPAGAGDLGGTATELISFDTATKRFSVKHDALDVLKGLGPVAVVAVCGRARMGKSSLLNLLVQKLQGGGQAGAKKVRTQAQHARYSPEHWHAAAWQAI
jgi:hypothetical protein